MNKLMRLRAYQSKYTGSELGTVIAYISSPYYSLKEIMYNFTVDVLHYQGDIVPFFMADFDARNYGMEYDIPVYYIMGENDYQTPYPLAQEFFEEISAPDKQFFIIPKAGHAAMVDNKAEFTRVLLEEIGPKLR